MNNKIQNKQISIAQIIEVAKYLEKYREQYQNMFLREQEMNKQKGNIHKQFSETDILYAIQFQDGKTIKENGFNWFIKNIEQPMRIKEIIITLRITFFTKQQNSDIYNKLNNIHVRVDFRDICTKLIKNSTATLDITTTHQEQEAYKLEQEILKTLNANKDRYNETIKYKKIRIQSFCISVGLIISYILYFIFKINLDKIPDITVKFLGNKYILLIGQWFVAIVLGNLFSYWYIFSLYKPILPWAKYAGKRTMSKQSVYKDDVEDYISHSEVQFGQYWDAERRRAKIEKIFKICKIILLVQVVISIILFCIIK